MYWSTLRINCYSIQRLDLSEFPHIPDRQDTILHVARLLDDIFVTLTYLDEQQKLCLLPIYVTNSTDNIPSTWVYKGDMLIADNVKEIWQNGEVDGLFWCQIDGHVQWNQTMSCLTRTWQAVADTIVCRTVHHQANADYKMFKMGSETTYAFHQRTLSYPSSSKHVTCCL